LGKIWAKNNKIENGKKLRALFSSYIGVVWF